MIKYLLATLLISTQAYAHMWTPTYPKIGRSHVEGVSCVEMYLVNRREDVSYYRIKLYDKDWNPITFRAPGNEPIQIEYKGKKKVEIFFSNKNAEKLEYVCTESLLLKSDVASQGIKSRICSKIKRD